jgi:DNA-binding CsgD family transcriptional regulator/tetratricopeptide (TPR) repeat protein
VANSEAALAAWSELGDQRGAARALLCLASVARYQDDFERAHELGEQSLILSRASGDAWSTAWAHTHLGMVAWVRGDRHPAIAHLEEGLALHRAAGDRQGVCESLIELAKTARQQGDFSRAEALLGESLALHRAVGDRQGICICLDELGGIAYDRGKLDRAGALLSEALALAQELGERRLTAYLFAHLGEVAFVTGDVPLASTRFGESLSLFWTMSNKWGIARCLHGFAALVAASGQPVRAARLLGAWAALHEAIGAPPVGGGDDTPATVQATLGPAAFAAAWEAGRALTLEQAIAEALATDALPSAGGAVEPPSRGAAAGGVSGATPTNPAFTRRELEILRLLAEGRTNPEIAAALSISRKTVANHVSGILAKLQVETRSAAAAQAIRLRLV